MSELSQPHHAREEKEGRPLPEEGLQHVWSPVSRGQSGEQSSCCGRPAARRVRSHLLTEMIFIAGMKLFNRESGFASTCRAGRTRTRKSIARPRSSSVKRVWEFAQRSTRPALGVPNLFICINCGVPRDAEVTNTNLCWRRCCRAQWRILSSNVSPRWTRRRHTPSLLTNVWLSYRYLASISKIPSGGIARDGCRQRAKTLGRQSQTRRGRRS